MALTADNTRVAVTGGVFVAPTGTTLVTDATTALDAAFDELGYCGEDGIQQTIDETVNKLRAWQNADVVRHVQATHDVTYEFTLLETNETVLTEFYGNYAANTGGGTEAVEIKSGLLPLRSWTMNIIDGAVAGRLVLPNARIIERGDVMFKTDEITAYPVTVECLVDSAGVKAYQYGLIPA